MLVGLITLAVIACLAALAAAHLQAAPDEATPQPPAPRRRVGPPADRASRVRARLTVCRTQGHDWTIAWPVGRRMRQCRACGQLAEPTTVVRFREERLS